MNLYRELSEKRKEGQENGTIPSWYTTAGLQLFNEKYLYESANIKDQFKRIDIFLNIKMQKINFLIYYGMDG